MELLECKYCKGTKFEVHDILKVYNPDTDIEEDIRNIHECSECGTLHFEIEEFTVIQISKFVGQNEFIPKLANYMNS